MSPVDVAREYEQCEKVYRQDDPNRESVHNGGCHHREVQTIRGVTLYDWARCMIGHNHNESLATALYILHSQMIPRPNLESFENEVHKIQTRYFSVPEFK